MPRKPTVQKSNGKLTDTSQSEVNPEKEQEQQKRKKKEPEAPKPLSREEKNKILAEEEAILEKQIDDLKKWIDMIENMNDEQKEEYLKNRPEELKTRNTAKVIQKNKPKNKRGPKPKIMTKADLIMASVRKFHKPVDEGTSATKSDA